MDQIEKRRSLKRSTPQHVLEPKHLAGTIVLPTRCDLLDRMPVDAVVAEVGVAFGEFTQEILQRTHPRKLHLIDMWDSDRYGAGAAKVSSKFSRQIDQGTVVMDRGASLEVLASMADNYFDWVYIDTDHSYWLTSRELRTCAEKTKPSGRILGHDFTSGNVVTPVPYGVIEACHEFCVQFDWRYEYLTFEPDGHFSFSLTKID